MDKEVTGVSSDESGKTAAIPNSFPRPVLLGSISGAQPKLLQILHEGKFYSPGASPAELRKRFEICDDLVSQFAEKSLESKRGKRSHLTETEILEQYRTRLIATKWTSVDEANWIIESVAEKIAWKLVRG